MKPGFAVVDPNHASGGITSKSFLSDCVKRYDYFV